MTTSGFFNTNNPAPDDLRSAAEILAEALAAAAAVAGDSEDAAEAAAAAQVSAASAVGAATQAADTLAAVEAARVGTEAAATTATASATQAAERAAEASLAVTDAATQAALAADHVAAAQAARDLAKGYRDGAGEYAADATASADAATSSAASAAAHASDAGDAAATAGMQVTAAVDAREAAQAAAGDAAGYATAASGFATEADGHAAEASGFALAAHGSAQDAAASVGQAEAKATQAADAAAAAEGLAVIASSAATVATNAATVAGMKADVAAASATAAAESAADAAAAAEAASGGGIKVSVTDTTPELLDTSIAVSGGLTKTIVNPGANERLALSLSVATMSAQGAMSAADKAKLDGLPAASSIATKTYADNAASAAVAAVIDAAPAELDTLREIAEHLADAEDTRAGLVAAVALKADKTYVDTEIAALAAAGHSHDFTELTNRPTSLTGYGITDAVPSSHVGTGGPAHAAASTSSAGFMTSDDKVKLNGIAAGAQVNVVTGVFGRTGAVVASSGDYTAAQIANAPTGSIVATTVQAAINELDAKKVSSATLTSTLTGKADAAHTHSYAELTGALTAVTAAPGDNSTAVATTEFVQAAVVASTAGVTSFNTRGGAVVLTAADVRSALTTNITTNALALNTTSAGATAAGGGISITGGPGGLTSGAGGGITISGGTATDGQGGAVLLRAGHGASNTQIPRAGGGMNVSAGNGIWGGQGGAVSLSAGNGGNANIGSIDAANGGPINITAGYSGNMKGDGGNVVIRAGASPVGKGGSLYLFVGAGGATSGDITLQLYGGILYLLGIPTSPAGLQPGAVWSDGSTLKIIP